MLPSYRSRRWAFAREATRNRLGPTWSQTSRLAIGVMGAVITYFAAVAFGQPPASPVDIFAAILGVVAANLLWAGAMPAWSYLAAPAEMDHEVREELERQPPEKALDDLIRLFDAHVDRADHSAATWPS